MTPKRALVLAGGGIAGIGWETGILRGIADESPAGAQALLGSDVLIGTSAGSTVTTQLACGLDLDTMFARQTAASSTEIDPGVSFEDAIARFASAVAEPGTITQKRQRIGALAAAAATVPEEVRRAVIAQRLPSEDWPARDLRLTAIDIATGELVALDATSGRSAGRRRCLELRGARGVAAGDDRGSALHGRRCRQHHQHRLRR